MKLKLQRFATHELGTFGFIHCDGEPVCFTLEDPQRTGPKIPGETCIPEGHYRIMLRTVGGFHARYSRRFPDMHRGMLWLQDVPEFEYILIHCGNTKQDTAGCILTGTSADSNRVLVGASKSSYVRLYEKVVDAAEADELSIEVLAYG